MGKLLSRKEEVLLVGSIYSICSDWKRWINTSKHSVLKDTKEPVTLFIIGSANYDYEGDKDIEIYIRDSVYEKLCSGEYLIDKTAMLSRKLVIKDKGTGKIIEPICEGFCY